MKPTIAVILCGSGYKDGSEIRESVATLYALSKHQINFQCFAPNENQFNVIDCKSGHELPNQYRNQLIESARIARGDVEELKILKAENYDAVIIPGGFGAAKNLCTYGIRGLDGQVHSDISKILNDFHNLQKPIGAICIAPIILAMTFKNKQFKLTFGKECQASIDAEKLGHTLFNVSANKCVVDNQNLIVTTPAYMDDNAEIFQIFEGIESLVTEIKKMIGK